MKSSETMADMAAETCKNIVQFFDHRSFPQRPAIWSAIVEWSAACGSYKNLNQSLPIDRAEAEAVRLRRLEIVEA